ncbi:FAD-binding oxidoreductase [Kutzneria kofuensis]|uniref:FAD-binding oxidoreductase n=1 Tax=Kutzneria kofuensis TaxID=103725 RepID=UPI003CD05908
MLDVDPVARTAVVQPGVVPDVLNGTAGRHGLHFAPDPSTHSRCTIGGMIGNNACGAHSVAWARRSTTSSRSTCCCRTGPASRRGRWPTTCCRCTVGCGRCGTR